MKELDVIKMKRREEDCDGRLGKVGRRFLLEDHSSDEGLTSDTNEHCNR